MAKSTFSNAQEMSEEARKAAASAFEALSQWRDDMAKANETYSNKVFDQMAEASRAMGWPESMIDTARTQMQEASRMQLQMMDQLMDTWSKQVKSPDISMANPADFMEQMQKFQQQMGMGGPMSGMPGLGQMPGMSGMAMAPFQMWMQAAEMWQRNMASAMSMWSANLGGDDKKK
jgi:hypothetical protein